MKLRKNIPQVTLVGAGPGDLELITVKGLKRIQKADYILYDALVNPELLEEAPNAKKLYVGKRLGKKAYSQDEINQLIVEKALLYGHVVRLKGGDPFVFGRGFEELQYIESFQIPVEIVPGLSSSIAVPELARIPVTHRGVSNSFHVISGTLANGELNPEIHKSVTTNGTVVILMGVSKLKEIVRIYNDARKGNEAIAVIFNGSLPNETIVRGNISTILSKVEKQSTTGPALLVIGEVVRLDAISNDLVEQFKFYLN
jgi:uroporphyrin-III C-methyltransferase